MRKVEAHQCPAYTLPYLKPNPIPGSANLVQGIRSLEYLDYTRVLVGILPDESDQNAWRPDGWCEQPKLDVFSFDFVLSSNGKNVPQDISPSLLKLGVLSDGFIINNITGIRIHIVKRLDGRGYDISKLGHYPVRPGHTVYINDTTLNLSEELPPDSTARTDVHLRLYVDATAPTVASPSLHGIVHDLGKVLTVKGYTALFGASLSTFPVDVYAPPTRFTSQAGLPVFRDHDNVRGCDPYKRTYPGSLLFVERGDCTFLDKLLRAQEASAAGVLVMSQDEGIINPTASLKDVPPDADISDVALVYLPHKTGKEISDLLDVAENHGDAQVMVTIDLEAESTTSDKELPERNQEAPSENRLLYINGLPLLNTRLLV